MRRAVVTIDWRTAAAGWPGGQLFLLDLDRFGEPEGVLDHFVGETLPQGLLEPGGWAGFRGVACRGGKAYVARVRSIGAWLVEGERLIWSGVGWSTRRLYDVHDIYPGEGSSLWLSATNADEVVRVSPFGTLPLLKEDDAWAAELDEDFLRAVPRRQGRGRTWDRWHVNSVAVAPDGAVWAFLHSGGHVVRIRPSTKVFPSVCSGGHSIRVGAQGEVLVLDTQRETVLVLDQGDGQVMRRIDCRASRRGELIDPNTGKKARSGWLRGCVVLDERHLICGTSPAQLFLVDYQAGRVLQTWQLSEDVRASTFGIDLVR